MQLREHEQIDLQLAHQQKTFHETRDQTEKQTRDRRQAAGIFVRHLRIQVSESATAEGASRSQTRVRVQVRLRVLREEVQSEERHEITRAFQAQGDPDNMRRLRQDLLQQQLAVRAPKMGAF